ncbi:MAG: apolipoprotein N-acyltransferase, partial [Deltaproteobacteria bacterium]|nr:apolipoprotein N-acyltransferase [Deltaproteobacteria bacterium]
MKSNRRNIIAAGISGLLLTASFPKMGIEWLAWFALVPLLYALRELSPRAGFRIGFIAGMIHYLSLLYWLVPVMRTYGYLPWYLAIIILILFAAVLAVFLALFAMILNSLDGKPWHCFLILPPAWISAEYIRGIIFSGFPWELLGYSQFERLPLIQISDILGVYGVSFLITLVNSAIFFCLLYFFKKKWQDAKITGRLATVSILVSLISLSLTLAYGYQRINRIDRIVANAPKARITVVQGNIDQAIKWDRAFQTATIKKYNRLSIAAVPENPDLVIWPESATPFYFLMEAEPTEMVMEGIRRVNTDFLFGSPSFARKNHKVEYYVSAYLISPEGKWFRYNKSHLVPYGEYV